MIKDEADFLTWQDTRMRVALKDIMEFIKELEIPFDIVDTEDFYTCTPDWAEGEKFGFRIAIKGGEMVIQQGMLQRIEDEYDYCWFPENLIMNRDVKNGNVIMVNQFLPYLFSSERLSAFLEIVSNKCHEEGMERMHFAELAEKQAGWILGRDYHVKRE